MKIPAQLFGYQNRPLTHPAKARMSTFLCPTLPTPPVAFDVDAEILAAGITIPVRMYDNDFEGDCVIAAQANQQTRFSTGYSGQLLTITDDEVQNEYMKQTGGADLGLVPDDSLDLWRTAGWTVAGKLHTISAWGRANATDSSEVKSCISLLAGMQLSMMLPIEWNASFNAGRPWDVVPGARLGSWGGHQVYVSAYDELGVYCFTWGKRQLITWAALAWAGAEANQGEAEAVVTGTTDVVDVAGLTRDLTIIAAN